MTINIGFFFHFLVKIYMYNQKSCRNVVLVTALNKGNYYNL